MNYTDTQLKQALAKMLPHKLLCHENWNPDNDDSIPTHSFRIVEEDGMNHRPVLDTELLHICWMVELTLSWSEYSFFKKNLLTQLMRIESATWQQRVAALAKVKSIDIV